MASSLSSMAAIVKNEAHRAEFEDMVKLPQVTNQLRQIQQSLEEPLDPVHIAQAYRSSQDLSSEFSNDRCMHLVTLLLRDPLLLRVCMDGGNWSNHLLQQQLTNVFNGSSLNLTLPDNELSQLLHAFNKIMTFGKSREEFDENLGLSGQDVILGGAPRNKKHPYINLERADLDHIFTAFSACASASPEHRSNNEKKRKRGKKRKRSPKVVEGLSDNCRMLDALEENLQRVQRELSLLKQQAQSVKLDPVSLSSLADIVKGLSQWLASRV